MGTANTVTFDSNHYVPILKSKRGEHTAIDALADQVRDELTPVFELPIVPTFKKEADDPEDRETVDDIVARQLDYFPDYWNNGRPAFLDALYVEDERLQNGSHPLLATIQGLQQEGVTLFPVTGLNRDDDYQRAVLDVLGLGIDEVMIRLIESDFERSNLQGDLNQLLSRLGVPHEAAHLLLDLGPVRGVDPRNAIIISGYISFVPNRDDWKTFSVSGAGYPEDVQITTGEQDMIPRPYWLAYRRMIEDDVALSRTPTYSDFGIRSREPLDFNPKMMTVAPKITYTTGDKWYLAKEKTDKKWDRFQDICETLVQSPHFKGGSYSAGDRYIADCAAGNASTGTPEFWVRAGSNHHLTMVVDQLASLHGSSTP
jgi:hypothetical protein